MDKFRAVIRCAACRLVQFQTASGNCRKCLRPLPLAPAVVTLVPEKGPKPGPEVCSFKARRGEGVDGKMAPRTAISLGRTLLAIRRAVGMTQQQATDADGMPRTYVSRLENGRMTPGPETLGRFAAVYGVSVWLLLQSPEDAEIIFRFQKLQLERQRALLDAAAGLVESSRTAA